MEEILLPPIPLASRESDTRVLMLITHAVWISVLRNVCEETWKLLKISIRRQRLAGLVT